jgi:hypothetical protein
MNRSLDEVSEAAFAAQSAWISGNRSRFELVDYFFDAVVPSENEHAFYTKLEKSLPRIKVLVSTSSEGFKIIEPTNRQELKDSIIKTTWLPYLTGWGIHRDDEDGTFYVDGGFSRIFHPTCETSLSLPMIWDTWVHTFNPGLDRKQVYGLWKAGFDYRHYQLPTREERLQFVG